jgi:hypothetical protein
MHFSVLQVACDQGMTISMVELSELTQCNNHFLAEYLPAVSETVAASVISTYLYSVISFSSSPDFRDFVIYHHSVSRRIEPHWASVANDRREESLGTRGGIRTARGKSDEGKTSHAV